MGLAMLYNDDMVKKINGEVIQTTRPGRVIFYTLLILCYFSMTSF